MTFYLAASAQYEAVDIALFRNTTLLLHVSIPKHEASALLISHVQNLLLQAELSITDLSYIVVNQGPGPFTTLRVLIATMNGIAFSSTIPLVGVDGLHALLIQYQSDQKTIALLNAYNKDVYFGIKEHGRITTGCTSLRAFLQEQSGPITFIGNGTQIYESEIRSAFPQAHIPNSLPLFADIQTIALMGLHAWKLGKAHTSLQPLYLKAYATPAHT